AASISFSNRRTISFPFSTSKRATLKFVGRVTCSTLAFSSGGLIAWGSGLQSVGAAGVKFLPDFRRRISGLKQFGIYPRNAPHIGKRRHVHDRHTRHPRCRHGVHKLPHSGRSILGLLHRKTDEIIFARVDVRRSRGRRSAGQV